MLPPAHGGAPDRLMILLHGYGADGNDLIGLGRHWAGLLPGALFVSPNAPQPCGQSPMGYEWFPLQLDRTLSRVTGAAAARPALQAFLEAAWSQTGLGPAETYLVGFSQGAMMALHLGLALDRPLRGIVAFSGALIPPEGFGARPALAGPILLLHGDADGVVDSELSRSAAAALAEAGYDVSLELFAGLGHGISPEALDAAGAFIAARERAGAA